MLALAPAIYQLAFHYKKTWKVVEKITTWSIAFVVIALLLPESFHLAGAGVFVASAFGLALPSIFERLWHAKASSIHIVSIALSLFGLVVHAMMDGAALTMGNTHLHHHIHGSSFFEMHALPIAVIVHQLPVGLFIWGLFFRKYGYTIPSLILLVSGLATVGGYLFGEEFIAPLHDNELLAYFQALFCGTLLHVVFDKHSHHIVEIHAAHHQHDHCCK